MQLHLHYIHQLNVFCTKISVIELSNLGKIIEGATLNQLDIG